MFMFRSKRSNLTRRLLRARQGGEIGQPPPEDVAILLRRLQDKQLEMLWAAVENRGRDCRDDPTGTNSKCVLLPREHYFNNINNNNSQQQQQYQQQEQLPPHVLCCQTWRWPDVVQGTQIRRLPVCRTATETVYVCCNPYHWSRVCQPEKPPPPSPPPYSRFNVEKLKPEDRAPSEDPESLTTSGEDAFRNPSEWCKIAYWEEEKRVGPLYPVDTQAVNIFGNVPFCSGLSLQMLGQKYNCDTSESVERTRTKIGLGVTLSREGDRVWVFNRSDGPIFVNALTLDNGPISRPTRVPADQCLCIYDPIIAAQQICKFVSTTGPINPHSIRISFSKGWGQKYKRQDITSCPCWLEIHLQPCR